MKRIAGIAAATLLIGSLSSCFKSKDLGSPDTGNPDPNPGPGARTYDWPAIADSAHTALYVYFWNGAGNFFTVKSGSTAYDGNYWPNAHALDVFLDQYLRKNKDAAVKQKMDQLVEGLRIANGGSLINYYYDDMEWMLLAALRTYSATNDSKYKNIVDQLWADVKGGWDNATGGGFYWRKDFKNKNTPANAPASIFASRLYRITNDPADLEWAKKIYAWLKTHVIQTNGDVYDGLSNLTSPYTYDARLFTYNYGIVAASAIELFNITGDENYKSDAISVINAAIISLSQQGIMKPGDEGDGGLFNGILARYMLLMITDGQIDDTLKQKLVSYLKLNAETMWSKGTILPQGLVGADWKTIPSASNVALTPQLSGVMLAEVMARLKQLSLIK